MPDMLRFTHCYIKLTRLFCFVRCRRRESRDNLGDYSRPGRLVLSNVVDDHIEHTHLVYYFCHISFIRMSFS